MVMLLFSFETHREMASTFEKAISGLQSGRFTVTRFDNGELRVIVKSPVTAEHCFVLGSIAPPDEQFLSVLLLAHTLKKEGARKVTALLPYMAYTRQDKNKAGESMATAWAGLLVEASGYDQVITIDVHSEADKQFFSIPLVSLSPAEVLAAALTSYHLTDATIVAPDRGAIARCEAVTAAARMPKGEIPYFEKRRGEAGVIQVGPIGKVSARVVMIDDILDTGGTLTSACEKLMGAGVQEIYVMVTHALFTGAHWTQLWSLGVKKIFCTDTVPLPRDLDRSNIVILSSVPLLQKQLLSYESEDSVKA
ncbi:MAG: ribose-phosphate pyrophosphokinase [Nitrospiraceae bacterium]|nr:MAG: ribose-phosphate pyrophosphokinase [Nitrospiraceae bacterium]